MSNEYAVVDLFAGPGGLAEGFASVRNQDGGCPFRIALSVEKDSSAHQTLLLRSFLRQFEQFPDEYYRFLNSGSIEPDWSLLYPKEWAAAEKEALKLELGRVDVEERLNPIIDEIREANHGNVVLIGGPPCQAYSLAGRARNRGVKGYVAKEDERHFLYRHYIQILDRLRPAAFVMENVKGMLSASVDGGNIFDRVLRDFQALGDGRGGYTLLTVAACSNGRLFPETEGRPIADYIVRAEDFGLPQARHRVIVIGLRNDIARKHDERRLNAGLLCKRGAQVRVCDVLDGMPILRSGLSRVDDSESAWRATAMDAMAAVAELRPVLTNGRIDVFRERALQYRENLAMFEPAMPRNGKRTAGTPSVQDDDLRQWLLDPQLEVLPNNETRGHMPSDLARYFFAALFGEVTGESPKSRHFPAELAPAHGSWLTSFPDRFRVQVWGKPSTTVTSHISKDGHAFIHPDPMQCRSLTVREAARLQTFPDNYYFKGNRTQQYIQVGNAVPPYLAWQIAESLFALLAGGAGRGEDRRGCKERTESDIME